MKTEYNSELPQWVLNIEKEDLEFIKEFVLASGSLKDIAKFYDVSYPTVRLRLDRLIEKIKLVDQEKDDSLISLIKYLAIEEKIDITVAKLLIDTYRKEK
ncbi:DUF2089 family protein [Candidatus Stoquefichus sp. SB1]|uniref:DUF2089 family protein n=1 Tax=Candidatus Stoquefichus sp. SB1 TaxID=1658109 RepID=UPI00067EEB75|nr:DUF2089 family protein [Candidatus Stoquefichus sp. SB1]